MGYILTDIRTSKEGINNYGNVKTKTKDQKIKLLREHGSSQLRAVLKSSFDPKIEWVLPEGDVPYTKNDAPAGTEHTTLPTESKKLNSDRFVENTRGTQKSN